MTSDEPTPPPATRWPAWPDLVPAGGALLYVLLGFFPWASVTFDVLGSISASGYRLSVLVPAAAVLLVATAVWTLLPAVARLPLPVPRSAVALGLASLASLLTLATWLRSTDYGVEAAPLLALLLTVAVAASAAVSLRGELRTPARSDQ